MDRDCLPWNGGSETGGCLLASHQSSGSIGVAPTRSDPGAVCGLRGRIPQSRITVTQAGVGYGGRRDLPSLPEVGAVCLNGHARICAGGAGQPVLGTVATDDGIALAIREDPSPVAGAAVPLAAR